jgi:hypothetical protein
LHRDNFAFSLRTNRRQSEGKRYVILSWTEVRKLSQATITLQHSVKVI